MFWRAGGLAATRIKPPLPHLAALGLGAVLLLAAVTRLNLGEAPMIRPARRLVL